MSDSKPAPPTDAATTDVLTDDESSTTVRGTIRVAPSVLIEMIELTVKDVDGVVELRSRPKRPRQDENPAGKCYDDGKVRVVLLGDQIETDIAVSLRQGVNIGKVTRDIQHQVARAVERMLGMTASAVNIYVDDVVDA